MKSTLKMLRRTGWLSVAFPLTLTPLLREREQQLDRELKFTTRSAEGCRGFAESTPAYS